MTPRQPTAALRSVRTRGTLASARARAISALAAAIPTPAGCRLTRAKRSSLRIPGGRQHPRRILWEMRHGPVPEGQVVYHTCCHKNCIAPSHTTIGWLGDAVSEHAHRRHPW